LFKVKTEIIAEIPDVEPSAPSVADSEPELVPEGPKQHIVFHSSSDDSNQVPSPAIDQQKDEDTDYDNDEDANQSRRAFRSSYAGRGNVQAVRAARKKAGLTTPFHIVTHYSRSLLHSCESQVLHQRTLPTR